jgi:hypothetical protein
MLEIEALFIAGLPSNKLELFDGRVPCGMAFRSRDEAEATFGHWVESIGRWKEKTPETVKGKRFWKTTVAGFELTLDRRRIDVRVPFSGGAHYEFCMNFWDPGLWPSDGAGASTFGGYEQALHELIRALHFCRGDESGKTCWRTDVVLTESSVLTPQVYSFRTGTWGWVGGRGHYLRGVPELVVEILTPATRADDLPGSGRRAEVLAKAGVRCYWLVDPGRSTLTVFDLDGSRFQITDVLVPGDRFRPRFPAGVEVSVAGLFDVEWEMPPVIVVGERPDPDAPSFCAPEEPIGIEHLLLAGHPLKRYEVLDDTVPCVLAFRDPAKARRNFEHWACEAARIEGFPRPRQLGSTFEAGRYRLWHDGNRVHLDLRYSGRMQREILEVCSMPGVWETDDSGDDEAPQAGQEE